MEDSGVLLVLKKLVEVVLNGILDLDGFGINKLTGAETLVLEGILEVKLVVAGAGAGAITSFGDATLDIGDDSKSAGPVVPDSFGRVDLIQCFFHEIQE